MHISGVHISERCYNEIPSVHCFYVKTNLLPDFRICISVPLMIWQKFKTGHTNGKCHSIPIEQNERKTSFLSRKTSISRKPSLYFNNDTTEQPPVQKHFSIYLDRKLSFTGHINDKINKAMKTVGLLRKLSLTRQCLLTIYKSFIRPHLDYGDVLWTVFQCSFSKKLNKSNHWAALAITETVKGTSRRNLCQELEGWDICVYFKKSFQRNSVIYLELSLTPPMRNSQRHPNTFHISFCRTEYSKTEYFRCHWMEWTRSSHLIF